jgi:hypothetical protein
MRVGDYGPSAAKPNSTHATIAVNYSCAIGSSWGLLNLYYSKLKLFFFLHKHTYIHLHDIYN